MDLKGNSTKRKAYDGFYAKITLQLHGKIEV